MVYSFSISRSERRRLSNKLPITSPDIDVYLVGQFVFLTEGYFVDEGDPPALVVDIYFKR